MSGSPESEVKHLNARAEDRPILALNCGSSSLKFGLYLCGTADPKLLAREKRKRSGMISVAFRSRQGNTGRKLRSGLQIMRMRCPFPWTLCRRIACRNRSPSAIGLCTPALELERIRS